MSKLQDQRKEKGLTQKELARISGVKVQTLQRYEMQDVNIDGAKLETLLRLALSLECKISNLLENKDIAAMMTDYEKILIIDDFRQKAIDSIKNK